MNTEHKYVPPENYMKEEPRLNKSTDTKHIEIVFNNSMSDQQLEDIKRELKSNGVTMIIERIKRNSKGLISDINVVFKTENGSTNYHANIEEGIKPFYFKVEDDGSFGVRPQHKNEVIIVEEIHKDHSKEDSKPNVFIFKEGDEEEVIEVREDSSGTYKVKRKLGNTFIFRQKYEDNDFHKKHDTIRLVTGYRFIPESDTTHIVGYMIDTSKVTRSFKIKTDNYFENDTNVKVIRSGKNMSLFPKSKNSSSIRFFSNDNDKPLIIVNGEKMSSDLINSINPNQIDSMTVLKGDDATGTYGKEAKNGVIIIKLKDFEKLKGTWTEKVEEDGPWKVKTNVSGYSYFYDGDDESENATFGIVTKTTTDKVLKVNKENLEKLGITVKYSKLKRNKAGEITSIKITLKNDKGVESSASYKDNKGIVNVEYGIVSDKLVVRSMD
jgi:hypothetical protein